MKKVLLRTLCLMVAALFALVLPIRSLAGNLQIPSSYLLNLIVSAPADITVNTDPYLATASHVVLGAPSINAGPGVTYTVTNNAPQLFPIGITKITWRVTDNTGNTVTAIQSVTVADNEKPYIEHLFEISVVNDPGQCGALVSLMIPYSEDNSGLPVTITNDAPAFFNVGSTLITWTATDAFGNADTSTQLITVIDNELPSITVKNVVSTTAPGKCSVAVDLGSPVIKDNCGVVSITNNAPAFFPSGITKVTWTVTDGVGYTATAVQQVTVTDNEKPVITVPLQVTVNNTPGKCGADLSLTVPGTSDNCGVASITNNAPAFLASGSSVLVTWTVTDLNGNTATASQTISVKDAEAPVFSNIPADVTVSCNSIPALTNPLVKDNCDAAPVVSFSQQSTQVANTNLAGYYNYTITRTWVAKDKSGNSATAKQIITVADKTPPSLSVPANISVANDQNICGAVVRYTARASSDNCNSPVSISYSIPSGSVFPVGTTTVTVTAKDISGNTTVQSFTVKVNDTQKPTITVPADLSLTTTGSTLSNVALGTPVTADNCGVKSVSNNAPLIFPVGITRITWTVTDNSGNTATGTQKITVTAVSGALIRKSNVISDNAITSTKTGDGNGETLNIVVAPNPSSNYFTLVLQSSSNTPVTLRITNTAGRVVEARSKLNANTSVEIGHSYQSGIYFAEMIQGHEHKVVQLIKL